MDAHALREHLEREGFHLSVDGDSLCVEPASALTTETRRLIRAHRDALMALVRVPATAGVQQGTEHSSSALQALVLSVARHYKATPDELVEIQRIALADPTTAWATFTHTAIAEGIQ